MKKLVEVDARGRVSLGPYAKTKFYLVEVDDEGVIILEPVVVMPMAIATKVDEAVENPEDAVRVSRPSRLAALGFDGDSCAA